MSWIDTSQYEPSDMCPICQEEYGTTQAIYNTLCNHNFHNNCLNEYCEMTNGDILCPVCRADLDYTCTNVWAFKEKALGNSRGGPLFNGNQHILDIYNRNQLPSQGGRRHKRIKKTKKIFNKNRKTRTCRRKRTYRKTSTYK